MHARTSEGTASAQRLLRGQLHRVDTSQLDGDHARMVSGEVNHTPGNCPPGICMGLPTCSDVMCEGHPCNAVREEERDPVATARFWRWYLGAWAVLLIVGGAMATRL